MNKKFILSLVFVAAALVLGVGLWLHFGSNRNSYTEALPADCHALVCMEPSKLMQVAGLSECDLEALAKIKEAKGFGLDWDKPMYAFYTASGRVGALASVKDSKALDSALTKGQFTISSQRGLQWVEMDGQVLLCFDECKVMALQMLSAQDKDQPRTELYDLMHQHGGNGKIPFADALESVAGSLRMAGELQTLAPLMNLAGLPVDGAEAYADVRLAAGCELMPQGLSLCLTTYDPNHRLDALLQQADGLLRPISGDCLQNGSQGAALGLCVNVDGARLLDTLRKNAQLRTALVAINMGMDLDRMIESMDGDVMLAVPSFSNTPQVVLTARMKNTDFMSKVPSWGGMGIRVTQSAPDACTLSWMGTDIHLGAKDKVCTISTLPLAEASNIKVALGTGHPVPADDCLMVCSARPRMLKDLVDTDLSMLPDFVRLDLYRDHLELRVDMAERWGVLLERLKDSKSLNFETK